MPDDLDLTAELDAAEETVVTEWGSREISPSPTESVFRYHNLSERTVRGILAARGQRGRSDALYRRTVTIGPWCEVNDSAPAGAAREDEKRG